MAFSEAYELKEKIGQGAFSKVHRCVHRIESKDYAAKIINTDKLSPRQREKLEREARICRKLSHLSIVRLHFTAQEVRSYYMVFDLIQGGELFDDIVARESYCEQDASRCIQQILEAIDYCHQNNIVHRDLKPENLLLESKKKKDVKLADFGLALEVDGNKKAWFGFAGTPGYMSPEVICKEPYGRPVDVWACGVILYILLVGYPPFWSDDQQIMFNQIKRGDFDFPSPEWDDVSEDAQRLIRDMLTQDQEARMTSHEALQHPWVSNRDRFAATFHRQGTVDAMKKFNAHRKLKGAILTTIFATRGTKSLMTGPKTQASQPNVTNPVQNDTTLVHNSQHVGDDSEELRKSQIIQLTQAVLNSKLTGDYDAYSRLCDPQMTAIEPETLGNLVEGMDFHKFYFDNVFCHPRVTNTTMLKPHVQLLGQDAAIITYTLLTQVSTDPPLTHSTNEKNTPQGPSTGCHKTVENVETRVWQRKELKWQLIHFHKSHVQTSISP